MESTGTPKPKTSSEPYRLRDWRDITHWRLDTRNGVTTACGIENIFQFHGWKGPVRGNVDCMDCLVADVPIMPLPKDFVWLEGD